MAQRIVFFAAVLLSAPAFAQNEGETAPPPGGTTVAYKCVNADGSVVFSESPCSTDPHKVSTIDTSSALHTGSGGHQDEIAASVADSDCRDRAYSSTHGDADKVAESNRHISEYEQRRQDLQQPQYATSDNTAALAELDSAVAREREYQEKAAANNEAAYQAALRACDEQSRAAEPPPAASPTPPAQPAPQPPPQDQDGG